LAVWGSNKSVDILIELYLFVCASLTVIFIQTQQDLTQLKLKVRCFGKFLPGQNNNSKKLL